MSDGDATPPAAVATPDAYSLLTKPTLDLSTAEVDIVIADLRERRARHLTSGKPDKPPVSAKAKPPALTKEAKADAKKANTMDLLSDLGIDIDWKV